MYFYNVETSDRFSRILGLTRTNAGISRRRMAAAIGVSESTIKTWEIGLGSPTLSLVLQWFHIVGESPFTYLLEFCWPETFRDLGPNSSDAELRRALTVYCNEVAGIQEIRKLWYLMCGAPGVNWGGVLDMFCAHVHTSLNSRYKIAEIIRTSFELSVANHQAVLPPFNHLAEEMLDAAMQAARGATILHKSGYTLTGSIENAHLLSSQIIRKARLDAGIDCSFLAKALGKTERTIRNWETSIEPAFLDVCAWFHILGKPLWVYLRSEVLPYETIDFPDDVKANRTELIKYISSMPPCDVRKLCYLIFAKHGSNWQSLLELMLEHACSPLSQRVISARSVLIGYQLDLVGDDISLLADFQPNVEHLTKCIEQGTEAAKAGAAVY